MGLHQTRQKVDTEKLLHWAFRDELPKKREGGWLDPHLTPLARIQELGTRVDESAREESVLPEIFGECHPDALVVEDAVLSLDDAPIDWPVTRRSMLGPLGGLLDDNEPTLKHLTIGCPGLVAMHAKLRTRPQWDLCPLPEPVIGANGKPKVQFLDERGHLVDGRKNKNLGAMARCPLMWFPAPREAAFVRIEYSIWWQALDTLADHLRPLLESHEALPPAAHPSPWMLQ